MNIKTGLNKIRDYLTDDDYRFLVNAGRGFYRNMSDEEYLKKMFKAQTGAELNLENPCTFNEKLQWLKLYNRNPVYTTMVDKYAVKEYIAHIIGEEYIIPTLGVWEHSDDIDFDSLPEQFVLKCTHDSGGIVICRDKSMFDRIKARKLLESGLKQNFYFLSREWPYRDVKPRIIAEEYLEDSRLKSLPDYKFFTFNGEVKALFVATERQSSEETKFDFFDENYHHLPFTNGHPHAKVLPEKPKNFDLMKQLASQIGQGIPHVRVDFYEANGRVYFGETTFFHWSGFMPFEPDEWDALFGSWITLPVR